MKFSDIPGHEEVKSQLRGPVDAGRMPHALMLSGPAGAGKMLLARTLAQYLQCENRHDGEPCGVCNNCRMHAEANHPDLTYVFPYVQNKKQNRQQCADCMDIWNEMLRKYPSMPMEKWQELLDAGNSQPLIYVNDAEEIVRLDSFPSYSSPYKVFIIWQPEKMNVQTANKLLKVIEEPSAGTVFILVSDNELQVLPTIFSRVRRVHVGRLSDSEIADYLSARHHLPPHDAARYAPMCAGSLARADEFGTNSGENEEFLAIYQEVMRAAYGKKVGALRQTGDKVAAFGREKNKRFLDYMARMIRENFIYNMHLAPLNAMTAPEESFSQKFSPFINHLNVEDFLRETDRARRDIERNANGKLVMFDYFLYIIIFLHRKPTK